MPTHNHSCHEGEEQNEQEEEEEEEDEDDEEGLVASYLPGRDSGSEPEEDADDPDYEVETVKSQSKRKVSAAR